MDIDRLGFELSLPDKEMPIAGASISLAVGVAMCGAMVGLARKGHALSPRSDIAWTGLLSPSGEVGAVDEQSLREKVDAVSAAGLTGIVVARSQGDLACRFAEKTGWDGKVYTVGQLIDLFLHPELMIPVPLPHSLMLACRRPSKQRYSATALLCLMVLSLLFLTPRILDGFGVYWFPWWRPLPTADEIPNISQIAHGFDLRIPRMEDLHLVPEGNRTFAFAHVVDEVINHKDEGPYLVLGETADFHAGTDGRLTIRHIPTRRIVAEYTPQSTWLPDDPGREESANLDTLKQGVVADVDNDGDNEVVISISFNPTSLCILQILGNDLRCERALKHIGHLEHLDTSDLNGDGNAEIVAVGFHGPTNGMSLLIAEIEDFYPIRDVDTLNPPSVYTAENLEWDASRQPCYEHYVLPYQEWMMQMPLDQPLMQLGHFTLAMPAHNGANRKLRATASLGVSSSDFLLDFDLDSPTHGAEVMFGQVLINRITELIHDKALPPGAFEIFLQKVRTTVHCSETIWTARETNEDR